MWHFAPEKETSNAFLTVHPTSVFISRIPSWKVVLRQLNHQNFLISFWKTGSLLARSTRRLEQPQQPGVIAPKGLHVARLLGNHCFGTGGRNSPAAKKQPKNGTKAPVAQKGIPGELQEKKLVFSLAVLLTALFLETEEENKEDPAVGYCSGEDLPGSCLGIMQWNISNPINIWVKGLEWNKGQRVSETLFTWFIRV